MIAESDLSFRLYKDIYGSGKVSYDDKSGGINLLKYGFLWQGTPGFNVGIDYNHIGDKYSIDGKVHHKVSASTEIASAFELDLNTKKIEILAAVKTKLDEKVTFASRVNHIGIWDLAFTAKVTDQLSATFTTGGSTKGIFDGKVGDESYSGLSFKFSL